MLRVLILGGDGYLGWPTTLRFSAEGSEVHVADNFSRRQFHRELGSDSLTPIRSLPERIDAWKDVTGRSIVAHTGDLRDYEFVDRVFRLTRPNVIVHYGEQPSAPYSMIDVEHAVFTQANNVLGTLNVLFAMQSIVPDAHLIKLGTMGEYGTPNIDIEEGFLDVEHKGRRDRLPFPKQPGSFYHLSKVHDSHNIMFTCRAWGLRATDLNQGVVYGIDTPETRLHDSLCTRFDYDETFGTALNRFCVQAINAIPLTVYGKGGQKRGFLNIRDTIECVWLAAVNPPAQGEYRVFNQFTEVFSVRQLAELVASAARNMGYITTIEHLRDPRVEAEEHYYNPVHVGLERLGLRPHLLSEELVESMLITVAKHKDRVVDGRIPPRTQWRPQRQAGELRDQPERFGPREPLVAERG
jgi:UDP-sulfoquinovose synthase